MRNLAYLDAQFMDLDGWRDPPNPVTPHLAFRSHSNFRAACEHALAGQLGDMFPMIRACIEAAAYAVHLEGNAKRTEAWLRRHDGAAAMKVARGRDFHHTTVLASVTALDAEIGALFGELYQQSIDYGGHPNERGLSANAQAMPDEEGRRFIQIYLHENGPRLVFGLHAVLEAGAAALAILRLVFAERLGPDDESHRAFRANLRTIRGSDDEGELPDAEAAAPGQNPG
ncbi:MAG: hypothetical protein Q7S93_09920 [Phenylobacterium sp.]|uniref:hypothetical protein n=1 Tax=Phenylobacterium sp. TaxID=1871053 RepID=UPI002719A31B|nr:hypothetical protein [Phenylobacterium sp.]MDO8410363.1 hypothetical protein [Phenylobacterium sp.]